VALHHVRTVTRPHSVEEAWAERVEHADETRFLAGGIDLVLYTPPTVAALIDLSGLGLVGVHRDGDAVVMGAMASLTDILESPAVREIAGGFLAEVFRRVASPLQRNLATLGGAVARAHPWSDVVPALLVLGAGLDVYDGRRRRVDLESFYKARAEATPPLVLAVRLPVGKLEGTAAFEKFPRTAFDVGALNCACFLSADREQARLAIGGTPALARRLPGTEEMLSGRTLDPATIQAVAEAAAAEIDARDDRRASGSYRRTLAEVGTRRCLERIAEKLEGRK
jgi:carbon-monoxide dehydrogenase medium subunit